VTGEPANPPVADDGLSGRVVSGARWIALLRIGTMATTWVTAIALARLLQPSQYGLVGMAMVLVSILTVFQESGLHAALIQRRERVQEAVDTAAAYAPIVGLVLGCALLAAAPLAGLFFHRGEVTNLVRALSVVFVLRGVSQVPIAVVQKELRFRAFAVVSVTGSLVQTGVAIALAASGAGAWSAIGGLIAFEAWCALLMWPICPLRPRPLRASLRVLRELLAYGRNMVGVNINLMIYSYVDIAVIGRFLGPASLGAYTIGYQTGKQPVANVTYASNQLIFPAYAKLQSEPERFRRAYLRSLRFITALSVPIGFGLAAVSDEFVRVVYGNRWSDAVPVLAIMALMGLVLSVTATMGEVLKATNRPGLFFRLSLLETVLVVAGVLSAYRFGIAAVAAAVAGSVTLTGLLVTRFVARILDIRAGEWLRTLVPPTAAGLVMVAGILATRAALGQATSTATGPVLLLLVAEGGALYILGLRLLARERLQELMRELNAVMPLSRLWPRLRRGDDAPPTVLLGGEER
jgi:O-antigen/teichoic acid export membrane protein